MELTYNDIFNTFLRGIKALHPNKTEAEYREMAKAETHRHCDLMREADEYTGGK